MNTINRIQRKSNILFHESTSFMRVVPDFVIVGTSFCGKTLLYNNLVQHKFILNNLREESGYFLDTHHKGFNWYKSNFPTYLFRIFFEVIHGKKSRVGETVNLPGYFVPKRVSEKLGKPKIIAILRNPVDRAYARYLEEIRNGNETKSFEEVLEKEYDLIKNKEDEIIKSNSISDSRQLFLYRLEGIYVEYLIQWNQYFPKGDILVIRTEDLFSNPVQTANKCFEFLDLEPIKELKQTGENYEKDASIMKEETRKKLLDYFKPHNEKLYQFLNIDLEWK
jgi:hypothetical protein